MNEERNEDYQNFYARYTRYAQPCPRLRVPLLFPRPTQLNVPTLLGLLPLCW